MSNIRSLLNDQDEDTPTTPLPYYTLPPLLPPPPSLPKPQSHLLPFSAPPPSPPRYAYHFKEETHHVHFAPLPPPIVTPPAPRPSPAPCAPPPARAHPAPSPAAPAARSLPTSPVSPPRARTSLPAPTPAPAPAPAPAAPPAPAPVSSSAAALAVALTSTRQRGTRHSDLQRNRVTSSRHRANRRDAHARRLHENATLSAEAEDAKACTHALVAAGKLDGGRVAEGMLLTPRMAGVTDFRDVNDVDVFVEFGRETTEVLGVSAVSDPVSHVLLEFLSIRRGMADVAIDTSQDTVERVREASREYDAILRRLWLMDDGELAPAELVEARFAEFQVVYHRWDRWETNGGGAMAVEAMISDIEEESDEEEEEELDEDGEVDDGVVGGRINPGGVYTVRAGAGGRRMRRSGEVSLGGGGGRACLGVKKCRRCNKYKAAGCGHRRSHCADGHPVSSDIPFREP